MELARYIVGSKSSQHLGDVAWDYSNKVWALGTGAVGGLSLLGSGVAMMVRESITKENAEKCVVGALQYMQDAQYYFAECTKERGNSKFFLCPPDQPISPENVSDICGNYSASLSEGSSSVPIALFAVGVSGLTVAGLSLARSLKAGFDIREKYMTQVDDMWREKDGVTQALLARQAPQQL